MKGLAIYKLNSSTYVKEFFKICVEFGIRNYCLISITSTDCLPGINYILKQRKNINVYFFKDLKEFYDTMSPKNLATLSKYGDDSRDPCDWLIVGYLDRLDIEQYKIKQINYKTELDIISGTTRFLLETNGSWHV